MDTDISPRSEEGMQRIIAAVEAHGDAVESDFLEIKSSLDMNELADLTKIAKFILAAANRSEEQAARNFRGEAVMIIGAIQGHCAGMVAGTEEYQLREKLRPYLGQYGPKFHLGRVFLETNHEVLFIVVNAPKAGDPLFPCHKDFHPNGKSNTTAKLQDGALYTRPGSNTRLATAAEVLALQDRYRASTAESISAWIEVSASPSSRGNRYLRRTTIHVDNTSDMPVYNVNVCVGLQHINGGWIPVGPLAVPLPLPVLAPQSQQKWDITVPLLACTPDEGGLNQHPATAIAFSDPHGQRWRRSFDGDLLRSREGDPELFSSDPEYAEEQAGPLDSLLNPIVVVSKFIACVNNGTRSDFRQARCLIDPAAVGWKDMTAERWRNLGSNLDLRLAAHVYYPAPRIAYVRAISAEASETRRTGGAGYVQVPLTVFTLRLIVGQGWRIHTIGEAIRPDMIEFPEEDLNQDVL